MSGRGSLMGAVLTLSSGRALGAVAAMMIPIVLVRLLDQAEFGSYKQLFLVFATLYGIAQFGMAESLFYFLPADPARGGRYVANAVIASVATGAACLLLLAAAGGPLAAALGNPALGPLLPLLGLFLLLMLAAAAFEIVLTVRKRHAAASIAYAASDWGRALLLIAPLALLGSLEALLVGAIVSASLRLIVTLRYLHHEYGPELAPDAALLARQAAYALPFGAAVLVEVAHANLHSFVVATRVDAATFAIYAVGCLQIPLVEFLMTSTGNVMMVRMGEAGAGDRRERLAIWHDATRRLALLLLPLATFLWLAAPELVVVLFTADYAASVPVFRAWTIGIVAAALLTDAALRVHAATRTLLLMNLARLGLVIALIGWALGAHGLVGAALVTVVATLVAKLIALHRLAGLFGCGWRALLPWRELATIAMAAALAAVPAYWVQGVGGAGPAARLVLEGLLYGAGYCASLLLSGQLRATELAALLIRPRRPTLGLAEAGRD